MRGLEDEGDIEPQVLCGPSCQGKLVAAGRVRSVGDVCESSWEPLCYCYRGMMRRKGSADSSTVHAFFGTTEPALQLSAASLG